MPVRVTCPNCKAPLQFPDDARGQTVRCSSCQKGLRLPAKAVVAKTEPTAAAAPKAPAAEQPKTAPRPAPRPTEPPQAAIRPAPRPTEPPQAAIRPARPAASAPAKKSAPTPAQRAPARSNRTLWIVGGLAIGLLMVLTAVGGVVIWTTGLLSSSKPGEQAKQIAAPVPKDDSGKDEVKHGAKDPVPNAKPPAPAEDLSPVPSTIEPGTVKKVKDATAYVKVQFGEKQFAEGSGFFAVEPGIVITNAHVVGMMRESSSKPEKVEVVVNSGQKDEFMVVATVLGVDRVHDLAVLRVQGQEGRLPVPLKVAANPAKLVETQKVYIFGFPLGAKLGKEIAVNESSIASFRKDADGSLFQIQVNGGMNPGNSGGPVVDARGHVIGVSVAAIRGTAINFAVPSEQIEGAVHGRAQDTTLGERFRDNQQIKLPVRIGFLDPLERVRDVKLEYWTGLPGNPRPATINVPAPVAGDSDRQSVAANYRQGVAKHDLVLPVLPPGEVCWLQATYVNEAGVKHWGQATSFKPSNEAPLERIAANLTVNPDSQLRTMTVTSKNEFQAVKGKEKFVEGFLMEMQLLEMLDKNERGRAVKLVPGKTSFFSVQQGKKMPRNAAAQNNVRNATYSFQSDLNGRLITFGFNKSNLKDPLQKAEADDMSADVTTMYQVASLGMPNRQVEAQESWEEKMRMLQGAGPKKEVLDLVLTCTYQGSRTVNGKVEALIGMNGHIKIIKSTRHVLMEPIDKLSGTAVFNVTDGMVSKLNIAMRAEFAADDLLLTDIYEIDYVRVPGNPNNIKPPAKAAPVPKGKIIIQKNEALTAADPMNPQRKGTRQKTYEVNFTAGKTYVIDMKQAPGSKLDPYLCLAAKTGKILAQDDDSGGGLNARIVFTATETDTYEIVATTAAPNQVGAFNLVVTEAADAKGK